MIIVLIYQCRLSLVQWFSTSGPWKHFEVGHRTFLKIARFIEKFCFICVTVVKFTLMCFGSFDGSNNE